MHWIIRYYWLSGTTAEPTTLHCRWFCSCCYECWLLQMNVFRLTLDWRQSNHKEGLVTLLCWHWEFSYFSFENFSNFAHPRLCYCIIVSALQCFISLISFYLLRWISRISTRGEPDFRYFLLHTCKYFFLSPLPADVIMSKDSVSERLISCWAKRLRGCCVRQIKFVVRTKEFCTSRQKLHYGCWS